MAQMMRERRVLINLRYVYVGLRRTMREGNRRHEICDRQTEWVTTRHSELVDWRNERW